MGVHHSSTREMKRLRKAFRDQCANVDALRWLCIQPIDYDVTQYAEGAFELDHFVPVSINKDLETDPDNFGCRIVAVISNGVMRILVLGLGIYHSAGSDDCFVSKLTK